MKGWLSMNVNEMEKGDCQSEEVDYFDKLGLVDQRLFELDFTFFVDTFVDLLQKKSSSQVSRR